MVTLEAAVQVRLGSLDLDVELAAGEDETVVVLGPNGAGKTTLLRALAGLVPVDRGRIALGGEVLDEPATDTFVAAEARGIGVVFQNHLLFPHLSALENVAFGLRARGMRRSVAREEAAAWLDRLGIGNVGEQRPGALSGGQAQRVALARALALEPRLLLFDEPLAALDVTTRVQVRRELARQLDGFDGARLLVTHDPVEAMALADRVLVIEAGRVQQCGTIAELRARPRSRYVADVVGVNLYRGRARGDQVRTDDGVELAIVNDEGVDGEVFVMVHPEAVSVHRRRPEGSPRNAWCGTVRNIDRAARHVRVDVDAAVAVTAEITEQSLADLELAPGSEVWVSVKATEIAMFPA